jgi:hypothetical protein
MSEVKQEEVKQIHPITQKKKNTLSLLPNNETTNKQTKYQNL